MALKRADEELIERRGLLPAGDDFGQFSEELFENLLNAGLTGRQRRSDFSTPHPGLSSFEEERESYFVGTFNRQQDMPRRIYS